MSRLRPPLGPEDHRRGERGAPAQLLEFGDFECPFCGEAYPIVEALKRTLGDRLCLAFRNFPIDAAHPHASLAAEAAEAAAAQGKFWEMHGMLYTHQDALERPDLEQYAARIGLDPGRFARDLGQHSFAAKVRQHLHSGALSGVNGTPAFYVNGQRHDGPWDYESLFQALMRSSGEASQRFTA